MLQCEDIQEGDHLAELHFELDACDSVLEMIERTLEKFQNSIGDISDEIRSLQDKSQQMNIRLKNRRTVQTELGDFVDQIMLPDRVVREISESEVNEAFLEHLLLLNKKHDFLNASDGASQEQFRHSRAALDLRPKLEKLCARAVSKVRQFLLQRMTEVKRSKDNVSEVRQNVLLKFKYFCDFLRVHSADAAYLDIKNAYVDIVSRHYFTSFKNYITALCRLEQRVATRGALIVEKSLETGKFRSLISRSSASSSASSTTSRTVFSLGDRGKILDDNDDYNTILPSEAQEKNQRYTFEQLFRSMELTFINTCTSEWIFICDFFGEGTELNARLFASIFDRVEDLLLQTIDSYLANSYDSIAILIMIQINDKFRDTMQKRGVHVLDDYFNQMNMRLWPRFKHIFDLNVKSVADANAVTLFNREKHSHQVVKRYAEYVTSIHALNREPTFRQMLDTNLATLRKTVERKLEEISTRFGNPSAALVFLINSYDIILNSFVQNNLDVPDAKAVLAQFESKIGVYMDLELSQCYGKLIRFVKKTEPLMSRSANHMQNRSSVNSAEMEELAKDFERNWLAGIEHINSNITKNFSNLKTGMIILKQTMIKLLETYTKFTNIVYMCYANPPFRSSLIGNQRILHEMRKFNIT